MTNSRLTVFLFTEEIRKSVSNSRDGRPPAADAYGSTERDSKTKTLRKPELDPRFQLPGLDPRLPAATLKMQF